MHAQMSVITQVSRLRTYWGATYKENTLFCSEVVFGYNYGILRYH